MYSKIKLSLKVSKNIYDHNKQLRAFMPNLIHSLDAASMCLLHKEFVSVYKDTQAQFYPIHDCFGTTCDKVFILKTILASVYTDIYSSEKYLIKFDNFILDYIENVYANDLTIDRKERKVVFTDGSTYLIYDVD